MQYTVHSPERARAVRFEPAVLLLAGYTGRDRDAVAAHVAELAEHGIAPPDRIPSVFTVSGSRLTHATSIDVIGEQTAGEAEFVLLHLDGELCVGVASDHTDRKLEAESIVKAKQVCDKPMAEALWRFDDIAGHWDRLRLRAEIHTELGWQRYQDGTLAEMLEPKQLLDELSGRTGGVERAAVFSGTVPIAGGEFRYGSAFRSVLEDPVLERSIECEYAVRVLPDSSL